MSHDIKKEHHESDNLKSKQECFAKAIRAYWKEIFETSTEGRDCLYDLTNALYKITPNHSCKHNKIEAFSEYFPSIEKLDTSYKSSQFFNESLFKISSLIHWYPNNVYEDTSTAIELNNYCANLVGKKRDSQSNPFLFYNNEILVGLFLLGPNHFYPEHNHPASEMWVILSGTAKWKRGSEQWQIRKPGDYFIHTPNQSHAMQTMDEPLLALWAWTGDLNQWAKWIDNE